MRISEREIMLAAGTVGVLLIGLTFVLGKPVLGQWKDINGVIEQQQLRLDKDRALIASKEEWTQKYVGLSNVMLEFPAEQKMDIHWLTVMEDLARKNSLTITRRQVGEEKRIGDVYELSIDVREWEGSLDSLVHFLFDLQNLGVMVDVKQLFVKPVDASKLRGRFTLNCAFSRKSGERAGE